VTQTLRKCLFLLVRAIALVVLCSPASAQIGPPLPDAAIRPTQLAPAPTPTLPADLTAIAAKQDLDIAINPLSVLDAVGGAIPQPANSASGESPRGGLSTALNIMLVLTVVSLAPSIMLMTTCFLRIIIVLGLLRQALGVQNIPPPQVLTALTLFMTLLVMSPTLDRINVEAIQPYRRGEVQNYDQLWMKTRQPVRDFMFAQIEATGNWSSLYMVLEYRGVDVSEPENLTREQVDMIALIPAYMLSELKVAFLMGFKVYLPFLVIDMVISTMLIAMSMMMLPPVLISLPFKLLLFVLVDGWTLVVGGLLTSFQQPIPMSEVAMMLGGAHESVLGPARDVVLAHASQALALARGLI
jgi:flagellar biosynthesis protein FliP